MNVAELHRQIEHKFAPEPLVAIQALANTYSFEDDEERLIDPESAQRWLVDSGLGKSDLGVSEAELDELIEFRSLIRELIEANHDGVAAPARAAELAALVAEHPTPLAAGEQGKLELDLAPAASIDAVISQMLGIVHRSQLEDEWRRLKICASDECRWAFYDTSRNRGGTWCQMEVCGNRIKNRRYRDRQGRGGSGEAR